jgi:hypothetical protein
VTAGAAGRARVEEVYGRSRASIALSPDITIKKCDKYLLPASKIGTL